MACSKFFENFLHLWPRTQYLWVPSSTPMPLT
ncbi:unnamed protein product, partial [Rotaria sp. Silwood2]